MKPSRLLILGGGLCLTILILVLWQSRSSRESSQSTLSAARSSISPENALGRSAAPSASQEENRQSHGPTKEKPRPVGHTVSQLRDMGFEITADRLGESSGEGNVTIRDPNGFKYTGNDFSISADGKNITLTGQVTMEMRTDTEIRTNTSVEKNAILQIAVDGTLMSLPGVSTVKTVPIEGGGVPPGQ